MRIHHIAYAVENIAAARVKMEYLGYRVTQPVMRDTERNIRIEFMRHQESGLCIELVEPDGEPNSVSGYLDKNNGMSVPYHICYETGDLEQTIEECRGKGFMLLQKPAPAIAIDGRRVAFLFSKDGGMIELVEIENR